MKLALPLALAATLAACATPSDRIADALVGYGIDRPRAECTGGELERNLSLPQLQELARLARSYREQDQNPGKLGADDFLRVAGQVRDPQVPVEVAKAAARCGLLSAGSLGALLAG